MIHHRVLPAVIMLATVLVLRTELVGAAEVRGSAVQQPSAAQVISGDLGSSDVIEIDMKSGTVKRVPSRARRTAAEAVSGVGDMDTVYSSYQSTTAFNPASWNLYTFLEIGDVVRTTRPSVLQGFKFKATHQGSGVLQRTRFRIRFLDANAWPTRPVEFPTLALAAFETPMVDLNLSPGQAIDIEVTNLSVEPTLPRDLLFTIELFETVPSLASVSSAHVPPGVPAVIGQSDDGVFVCEFQGFYCGELAFETFGSMLFEIYARCASSQVSPSALNLSVPLGGSASAPVNLFNDGCEPLTYSISNAGLVSLTPTSGTIPPGGLHVLTAVVTPGLAPPGFSGYGNVVITSNDAATPTRTFRIDYTVTGSLASATEATCYATQTSGGTPRLYKVDLATGAATEVGPTSGFQVPALAIEPIVGRIFGGITTGLVNVDAASGTLAFVAGADCWSAMTFTPSGGLLKMGCDSTLYAVNTTTGSQTALGQVSPFMGGLAIDPTTGWLYGVRRDAGPGIDQLFRIAYPSGATTLIGTLGLGLPIGDITFDETGRLFGVVGEHTAPNQLVSINKTTGQASVIGPTGVQGLSTLAYFPRSVVRCRFATSVVAFSSEFEGVPEFSAQQVLGPPNVYPMHSSGPGSWASATADGQSEYLHLAFSQPAPINYVNVYETSMPGAIRSVRVKNPGTGLLETVWTGTPAASLTGARIFTAAFPVTPYAVSEVYLDIASDLVPYHNMIDAVEIGYRDPLAASQWASSVVGFSSQFSATAWSAQQALGPPDLYPLYGDHPNAWASASEDGQREYLELAYALPSRINFVTVLETFLPGALDRVLVKNPGTGLFQVVWSGTAAPAPPVARANMISFPKTAFPVSQVRLEFNSPVVPGWNEIDAVGIGSCECPLALLDSPPPPSPVPSTAGLEWARPNPFQASTSVGFSLAREGHVEIEVFNLLGQRVTRLVNGSLAAGRHDIRWDGRDGGGRSVENGIYYLRMKTDGHASTRKIIKLQ